MVYVVTAAAVVLASSFLLTAISNYIKYNVHPLIEQNVHEAFILYNVARLTFPNMNK